MRSATWRACLLLAALAPVLASGAEPEPDKPALMIFVGKLTEVRELNYDCGENCWNFDSGFQMKYEVIESLRGEVGSPSVSFEFFGHYGLPSFAQFEKALVFVYKGFHQNVMARYLAFPVEKTTDGSWAYCGDPYPGDTPARSRQVRSVKFESPVALSPVTERFRDRDVNDDVVAKMKPGSRRCGKAVAAEDLVDFFEPQAEPGYNRIYNF